MNEQTFTHAIQLNVDEVIYVKFTIKRVKTRAGFMPRTVCKISYGYENVAIGTVQQHSADKNNDVELGKILALTKALKESTMLNFTKEERRKIFNTVCPITRIK